MLCAFLDVRRTKWFQVERNTAELLTPKEHIELSVSGWVGVELDGGSPIRFEEFPGVEDCPDDGEGIIAAPGSSEPPSSPNGLGAVDVEDGGVALTKVQVAKKRSDQGNITGENRVRLECGHGCELPSCSIGTLTGPRTGEVVRGDAAVGVAGQRHVFFVAGAPGKVGHPITVNIERKRGPVGERDRAEIGLNRRMEEDEAQKCGEKSGCFHVAEYSLILRKY